jgi:DNA polymerase-3 subunit delta'
MKLFSNEILGQGKASDTLLKFYKSGKIPHALLFVGKEGIGKFYTALEFIKLINVSPANQLDPGIFKKLSNLNEPLIKFITPLPRGKSESGDDLPTSKLTDETIKSIQTEYSNIINNPYHKIIIENANNIKINSIREIKKFISFSFDDIKYKVILIYDAHLMNQEAQNALLKNLEEPPDGVIFILLTSNVDKLLPTIRSRCWSVPFRPLSLGEVEQILVDYFKIEKEVAQKAAYFSDGSVHTGIYMVEKNIEMLTEKTIHILRYSLAKRYSTAYNQLMILLSDSPKETLPLIINMILKWFNDAAKNRIAFNDYYFEEYKSTFEKFNVKFKDVYINEVVTKLDKLSKLYDQNVSLNLIAMNIILELASIRLR